MAAVFRYLALIDLSGWHAFSRKCSMLLGQTLRLWLCRRRIAIRYGLLRAGRGRFGRSDRPQSWGLGQPRLPLVPIPFWSGQFCFGFSILHILKWVFTTTEIRLTRTNLSNQQTVTMAIGLVATLALGLASAEFCVVQVLTLLTI